MTTAGNQKEMRGLQEAQINKALGAFLLFFALVLLVSIFFTDTRIGRLTNLGAGSVIGGIGGVMFLQGLRTSRRRG